MAAPVQAQVLVWLAQASVWLVKASVKAVRAAGYKYPRPAER